ncbi:MAG: alpha/beta fold hydrolase [Spirochaetales bacterium]|nr:alpha/beta fold hydrolase [Spirochaetales bacterium]
MIRHLKVFLVLLASGLIALSFLPDRPFEPDPQNLPADFDSYYGAQRTLSRSLGVPEHSQEKILEFGAQTELCFLYIHGFTASRGEGEEVVDALAQKFRANTYYVRLPGHGSNPEDLRKQTSTDYLQAVEEAYHAFRNRGKRCFVIATSMGGLLALHLASRHPELAGLILASPAAGFHEFYIPWISHPWVLPLLGTLSGDRLSRNASQATPEQSVRWYQEKYTASYAAVFELWRRVARPAVYAKIQQPVLLMYYYRDEEHQDSSVDVKAMLQMFSELGERGGHPQSRTLPIARGNHVLLSRYVDSDRELARREMQRFIEDVTQEK